MPETLQRVPTGIAGLDLIVRGGLLTGGAYIVMGLPGTGKTTLGTQVAFSHVARGGRALYVTLLAETHARMLQHMASFQFFDPKPIGRELSFVSAFNLLESDGLKGVLGLIQREVVDKKVSLLVMDGLVTAEAFAPSEIDIKKFIHEVQALLSLSHCTALLLTNPAGRSNYPAHTMVDGMMELRDDKIGLRAVRRLNVFKFRGSEHLRGEHVFDISPRGITVHPRLESLALPEPRSSNGAERVPLGVAQLDRMLGGGVTAGSTTLVLGPTGSGKTLVGLRFLATGAERGETALYYGFSETQEDLCRAAAAVHIDLKPLLAAGKLELRSVLAIEGAIDELAEQILEQVRARGARRLFIDGLSGMRAAASDPERTGMLLVALTAHLRAEGVTIMVSEDTNEPIGHSGPLPTPLVAARADNIVSLRHVELRSQLHRMLSILKERGSECDRAIREFVIGNSGIDVSSTFQSAEEVLGDLPLTTAKPSGKPKPRGRGRAGRRS